MALFKADDKGMPGKCAAGATAVLDATKRLAGRHAAPDVLDNPRPGSAMDAMLHTIRKETTAILNGGAGIDLGKTVEDMLGIIKSMEGQLSHVLDINSLLERDLDNAKDRIVSLRGERDKLQAAVARLEDEMPLRRELQMGIDQLLEERNEAELRLRGMKRSQEQSAAVLAELRGRVAELEGERKELIDEIQFLETRLGTILEKNKVLEERAAGLEQAAAEGKARVKDLECDLQLALEEKFKAAKALKDAQQSMMEFQERLRDTREPGSRPGPGDVADG
ncbi:hypothetical protein [Solidesulfovibrio magneticus]|uniref:Uncharacterized protein n=1 Tax=Solidesulfovibrio magneticus (strain ATCC 700980 / DSM 13731 / RS-1) TaxID=573370 RepID=C4XP84_SOLM1|nr:hypothetical protein [Solidesulfovibrio magneticus]BAH77578.1 hypothetical protein DMR_40870 [Solidesulfovibrio magneticus RS-1]